MNVVFTVCSNNYLAQAKILWQSLKKHEQNCLFIIFLCDEKRPEIDYTILADEVIPIGEIEPQIVTLAEKYNIIELNTCIKPRVIEYLFEERKVTKVIYLDPDIKLFDSIAYLYNELDVYSILLTPHIYTPIPIDNKKPSENTFLNFGIYNLGFLALHNDEEAKKFVSWWKEHTYKQGYIDTDKGIFVDQLPITLAPLFFKHVHIINDVGLNMAPWNLHERFLTQKNNVYIINEDKKLKFFHFSSFKVDANELPLMHYDRFRLADRPDLHEIYKEYNNEMKKANHTFYAQFKSIYSAIREAYAARLKRGKMVKKIFLEKLFSKRAKK